MNEFQIMHRIPDSVTEKLNSILQGEDLAEVYMFLASNASNPCFVQVLNTTVHDDLAFRATVKTMLDDVKNMKEDGSYSRVMADVWNALMPFSDQSGATQSFNLSAALAHPDTCKNATSYNMITIIARMPPETLLQNSRLFSKEFCRRNWSPTEFLSFCKREICFLCIKKGFFPSNPWLGSVRQSDVVCASSSSFAYYEFLNLNNFISLNQCLINTHRF